MDKETPLFWDVIETRRSIRVFADRPVPQDLLERVLKAAVRAPNAHNAQTWRFIILRGEESKAKLADALGQNFREDMEKEGRIEEEIAPRLKRSRDRLMGAPVVVLLGVETADFPFYDNPNRDLGEYQMAVQSAALGAGQLLLTAHAVGLGGVWICAPLFAPEAVQAALKLPETWLAQGMLLLGYPGEEPEIKERKPLKEVVKYL